MINQHSLSKMEAPVLEAKYSKKLSREILAKFIQIFHSVYSAPNVPILASIDCQ